MRSHACYVVVQMKVTSKNHGRALVIQALDNFVKTFYLFVIWLYIKENNLIRKWLTKSWRTKHIVKNKAFSFLISCFTKLDKNCRLLKDSCYRVVE